METVTILGIPFNALNEKETLDLFHLWLGSGKNHIVATPNPEGVMQAGRNETFKQALLRADLRLADGAGIILASRLLSLFKKAGSLPCRVRGYDIIIQFFQTLSQKNLNVTAYFLGAAPGVAEKARENMERQYPGLRVAACHNGFFDAVKEKEILAEIRALQPDILLVCTGMPRAEIWAVQNKELPVRITLCLGGTLDIMSGNVRLAPAFMRKIGLEWLYRLLSQPSRAKRMLDLPRFLFAFLVHCLK